MKRKILTVITIGSIFCMALTGCGDSSRNQATSDRTTKSDVTTDVVERLDGSEAERESKEESGTKKENPKVREAGLYQSDGSFIPWDDLGIDVETDYTQDNVKTEAKSPYKVFNDNNYNGNLVFPDNITKMGDCAFWMCTSLESVVLPDALTSIGELGFWYCDSLTNIDLPDTLTSIGDYAFQFCSSLESIDLPNTLTSIGKNAFEECPSLTSIDLSNTQITSIEYQVFSGCSSLTNIDLPDTLTSIEAYAFNGTSLKSIDLPDTLTSIGVDAFANTSLININYAGTMREWEKINKAEQWYGYKPMHQDAPLETITCTDGVITL